MGALRVVVIGVFYAAIVAGAVGFLAAAQMRADGGAKFDQWRLNYEAQRARVTATAEAVKNAAAAVREAQVSESRATRCLEIFRDDKLRPDLVPLVDEVRGVELEKLLGEKWCVANGLTQIRVDLDWWRAEVGITKAELDRLNQENTGLVKALGDMERERADHLSLVRFADSNTLARVAVVTPYDLLLMLLVIAMGALGGVARLVRDYGATGTPNPSVKDYLIIPLIGGAVAVGGFVAARSGLLLLSANGTDAALSPYTISFIGIISGLLAPEVIDRIAAKGRDVLKGEKA
jgi:hypothetical protein